jgi:transcriptional regulator with XRE-family HTH domain
MELGKAIKQIRVEISKQNQLDFATGVGITQTHLSQVENGKKNPSQGLLKKIAAHVKIPANVIALYALTEDDVPDNKKEAFNVLIPAIKDLIVSSI